MLRIIAYIFISRHLFRYHQLFSVYNREFM